MKKLFALLLALTMLFALAACGKTAPAPVPAEEPAPAAEPAPAEEPAVSPMSYAEFAAAELDTEVTVKVCVQATESWWDNKIKVYGADADGAYFIYEMVCSEEDAAKLVPGTWILVNGWKSAWSGEVEVAGDPTFRFLDGEAYIAEAQDVTDLLGKDELIEHQNQLVRFSGLTVEPYDESGAAFAYKDEAGQTDDLYFKVSKDGEVYDFCVEFYLCGKDTDVYKAVEGLKVGDVIDAEGFLYWYNGANPHITSIKKAMSYEEYAAAELDTEVMVKVCVQATESWWDNKIKVYGADADGAYFIYEMVCSEEDAAKLVPGTWILVNGWKSAWSGEVEVAGDPTFRFLDGEAYIAEAQDVTDLLGKDELIEHQNQLVRFSGLTVEPYDESGAAFAYKDEAGQTDDLYFKVSKDGEVYDFCVEFYLCGKDTDVYKAVEGLKVGDVIDVEGFLYWYNGVNPHVTSITVK